MLVCLDDGDLIELSGLISLGSAVAIDCNTTPQAHLDTLAVILGFLQVNVDLHFHGVTTVVEYFVGSNVDACARAFHVDDRVGIPITMFLVAPIFDRLLRKVLGGTAREAKDEDSALSVKDFVLGCTTGGRGHHLCFDAVLHF